MPIASATIVTPCRDAVTRIAATAESVLGQTAVQSGRLRLQYLVCDGGSRDGTVELARRICGDRAEVRSEADAGMYHALAKGLGAATGDVVAYLNAGDVYHPAALDVVADVLEGTGARWLTGMRVTCNEKLQVTEALLPYRYRRSLLQRGLYGRVLPFLQQESTFWRRELLAAVDLDRLARLRLAGDFYLWRCFAGEAEPTIVEAYLGGFTVHRGQQSEQRGAYLAELESLRAPDHLGHRLLAWLEGRLWSLPAPWKKRLNPRLLRYDHAEGRWA